MLVPPLPIQAKGQTPVPAALLSGAQEEWTMPTDQTRPVARLEIKTPAVPKTVINFRMESRPSGAPSQATMQGDVKGSCKSISHSSAITLTIQPTS